MRKETRPKEARHQETTRTSPTGTKETVEFRRQVTTEIGTLREKVDRILEALHVKEDYDPWTIIQELDRGLRGLESPIRWITAGTSPGYSTYVVLTGEMADVFEGEDANPEQTATFIQRLADPTLLGVCRQLFLGHGRCPRVQLKEAYGLTDEALEAAIKPLLEWELVVWRSEDGQQMLCEYEEGPGIRFIITLFLMTRLLAGDTEGWKTLTGYGRG